MPTMDSNVVSHPRTLLGSQEVARGGGEEVPRRLGVGCLYVGDIDDGLHPTRAASRPAPVDTSTPHERATTTVSCPARRSASTVWRPADAGATDHAMRIECPPRESIGHDFRN